MGAANRTESAIRNVRPALQTAIAFLHRRPLVTFVAMGASFLLFGVTSVDLYMLIAANLDLFVQYGWMVVDDGALRQLAELLALAALSGVFYVAFALCDRTLLRSLTETALRGLRR